jgi:hypothetical protein
MIVKLDYRMGEKTALSGHYALYDQQRTDPYEPTTSYSTLPGFATLAPRRSQHASIRLTQTPGTRAVLETRLGWHAPRHTFTPENQVRDYNAVLGFPSIATDPVNYGYPSVVVVGYARIGEGLFSPGVFHSNVLNAVHSASIQPASSGGRHLLQFGGSFLHVNQFRGAPLYGRGLWSFNGDSRYSPLEQLVRGVPSSVLAGRGNGAVDLRTSSSSLHLSDNIRLGRRLTLQAGLRYEFNRPPANSGPPLTVPDLRPESGACTPQPTCLLVPASVLGLPASTYRSDRNNFGPRLGLAWQPPAIDWLVVRAAYGIYYDNAVMGVVNSYSYNPPFLSLNVYPGNATATVQSVVEQQGTSALALVFLVDPDLRDAYVQQWNFNLQAAIGGGFVLETAYVGSKGTKLTGGSNPNQLAEGGGPPPFPQLGPFALVSSRASSNYHSMQVRLERRFLAGSSFLLSYTRSKSIDDASTYLGQAQAESSVPQNSRDLTSERALSTFDTRQRLAISYLQELPLLAHQPGLVRAIVGGWQLGLLGSFHTGFPFPIRRLINQSGTVPGPRGDLSDRPDVVGDPTKAGPVVNNSNPACRLTVSQGGKAADKVGEPGSWFNPCAFDAPATLRFGNSARNNVIGPGLANFDVSVAKRFYFRSEQQSLQLRFEMFNLFNRPHFDLPQNFFDSATFGAVSSSNLLGTSPPRQLQIGIRYQF